MGCDIWHWGAAVCLGHSGPTLSISVPLDFSSFDQVHGTWHSINFFCIKNNDTATPTTRLLIFDFCNIRTRNARRGHTFYPFSPSILANECCWLVAPLKVKETLPFQSITFTDRHFHKLLPLWSCLFWWKLNCLSSEKLNMLLCSDSRRPCLSLYAAGLSHNRGRFSDARFWFGPTCALMLVWQTHQTHSTMLLNIWCCISDKLLNTAVNTHWYLTTQTHAHTCQRLITGSVLAPHCPLEVPPLSSLIVPPFLSQMTSATEFGHLGSASTTLFLQEYSHTHTQSRTKDGFLRAARVVCA